MVLALSEELGLSTVESDAWDIEIRTSADTLSPSWETVVAPSSVFLSRAFLAALEKSVGPEVRFMHALVRMRGRPVLAATFSTIEFTLAACLPEEPPHRHPVVTGAWKMLRAIASIYRCRMLFCGNALMASEPGFTHVPALDVEAAQRALLATIDRLLDGEAAGANMVFIKDLPAAHHGNTQVLDDARFGCDAYQPSMVLRIPDGWRRFDDYLNAFRSKYRTRMKSIRKKGAALERRRFSVEDTEAHHEVLHRLHTDVARRSQIDVTNTQPAYLAEVHRALGERCEVTGYVLDGELVGFAMRIFDGDAVQSYALGMRYDVVASHALYLNMLVDDVERAIERGAREVRFGRTALEMKSTLGAEPVATYTLSLHRFFYTEPFYRASLAYFVPRSWPRHEPFRRELTA